MDCKEIQLRLSGYLDHELDLSESLVVEQHLANCAVCSDIAQSQALVKRTIRQNSLYYTVPERLSEKIRSEVLKNRSKMGVLDWPVWRSAAMVALLLTAGLAGWKLAIVNYAASGELVANQILQDHLRSLLVDHVADVQSTDQHTVKPWFNGKLDFSPTVKDLSSEGFPLMGGRLDYVSDHPVAALVYGRHRHLINVFTWPSADTAAGGMSTHVMKGYNLVSWDKAGMTYWAISDVNLPEMQEFVRMLQQ